MSNLLSTYASGYNQAEQERIEARFQAIESYVGMQAATAYLGLNAQLQAALNGTLSPALAANSETSTTNAAALSIAKLLSNVSAAGAQTRTLAAPTADGQLKMIVMTVHGGDVTIAATNIQGGTGKTLTLAAVGDCAILVSLGGKWIKFGGNAVIA
jgi:hypothetical protein